MINMPTNHTDSSLDTMAPVAELSLAARLQTLDQGFPISTYTVARELGHGGDSLIKRVYGHLGTVRHRSEHAEFRIEQHQDREGVRRQAAVPADRLARGHPGTAV